MYVMYLVYYDTASGIIIVITMSSTHHISDTTGHWDMSILSSPKSRSKICLTFFCKIFTGDPTTPTTRKIHNLLFNTEDELGLYVFCVLCVMM